MGKIYEMLDKGYYGWVYLEEEDFNKIPVKFLISGCTEDVKYMCSNPAEETYLKSLGVKTLDYVDWYKIIRKTEEKL